MNSAGALQAIVNILSTTNCDQMNQELQTIKMISTISGYLAITTICIFIGTIVLLDILDFCIFLIEGKKIKK